MNRLHNNCKMVNALPAAHFEPGMLVLPTWVHDNDPRTFMVACNRNGRHYVFQASGPRIGSVGQPVWYTGKYRRA